VRLTRRTGLLLPALPCHEDLLRSALAILFRDSQARGPPPRRGALVSLLLTVACLDSPILNTLLRWVNGIALRNPERPLLGNMPIPRLEFFRERAPPMGGVNMRFAGGGGGGAVGTAPPHAPRPHMRRDNLRARLPPCPVPPPRVGPTVAFRLA
jgi:hypothetical protein